MEILKFASSTRFSLCSALALALLVSVSARAVPEKPSAMPDGGCWADPMNNLTITLGNAAFSSNIKGSIATVNYETVPRSYDAWCYSTSSSTKAAGFFQSKVFMPASDLWQNYFKLNSDVDYQVRIDLGIAKPISPFKDHAGKNEGADVAGPEQAGVSKLYLTGNGIGGRGVIYFKLRRTLLGGAFFFPGGLELANMYRYVYKGNPSPTPIYRLFTGQTVIPVPVECRINNGRLISVPFGIIDNSQVNTSALQSLYKAERPLTYRCNTSLTQDIMVNVAAEPAGFADAIKTSNADIGVVMLYQNQTVKPNAGFKSKLVRGLGSDSVTFAVVGSGKTPATGPFTGSATLIISNL